MSKPTYHELEKQNAALRRQIWHMAQVFQNMHSQVADQSKELAKLSREWKPWVDRAFKQGLKAS